MAQTKRAAKKKAQRFSADAMAARLIGGLLLVAIGLLVFLSAAVSMRGSVFDLSRRVAFGLKELSELRAGAASAVPCACTAPAEGDAKSGAALSREDIEAITRAVLARLGH